MNGNKRFFTAEQIGRLLGTTPEQVKRFTERGLQTFTPENERTFSKYPFRIWEADKLAFFNCNSFEDFQQLKYRG
ncbi:hypothetical protein [Paenibacillus jilunlii]|uniref:Uncharacterized protein n=1 Tax=Paenibacillus jilunlii TaxID=682956 RepID=A0A1G9WK36_9BACL|nr:hypothetical protein [Paenibacillus jilunlii]KWX73555.1 hypothetical protein AML91_17935 [Paenibacillus jilunlii]SDM84952.1 hypothetical protein SAMN05216191_119107 [Paenibacillus jilunlii]